MNECTKKISTSSQEALVEETPNVGLNGGPVKPLDGGWGWVVCLACFIGNLTDKIIAIITYISRNNMKGHFKVNFVADGLVYSFGVFIKPLSEVNVNRNIQNYTFHENSSFVISSSISKSPYPKCRWLVQLLE